MDHPFAELRGEMSLLPWSRLLNLDPRLVEVVEEGAIYDDEDDDYHDYYRDYWKALTRIGLDGTRLDRLVEDWERAERTALGEELQERVRELEEESAGESAG